MCTCIWSILTLFRIPIILNNIIIPYIYIYMCVHIYIVLMIITMMMKMSVNEIKMSVRYVTCTARLGPWGRPPRGPGQSAEGPGGAARTVRRRARGREGGGGESGEEVGAGGDILVSMF